MRLELIIPRLLSVLVQIDKSRGDDEPLRVHGRLTLQRTRRNRANFSATDPDASHGIQARFRVHHTAVRDDHIVSFVVRRASCPDCITQNYSPKNYCDSYAPNSSRWPLPHLFAPFPHTPKFAALSLFTKAAAVKGILSCSKAASPHPPEKHHRQVEGAFRKASGKKKNPGRWGERPGWGLLLR